VATSLFGGTCLIRCGNQKGGLSTVSQSRKKNFGGQFEGYELLLGKGEKKGEKLSGSVRFKIREDKG